MVFAMIMMFREGSRDKLIQKGFTNMRESTGTFPATIARRANVNGSVLENNTGADNVREIIDNDISSYEKSWNKYLQLPVVSSQRVVIYRNLEATYSYVGYGHVDLGYIDEGSASGDVPEEDMSKH
jgi:putative ABC transport system permease protein